MDRELKAYLDLAFRGINDKIDAAATLNAEAHSNIHGRIDSTEKVQETLAGRLWGLAAVALGAIITGCVALVVGQKAQ